MAELENSIVTPGGGGNGITQERVDAVNAKIAEVKAYLAQEHGTVFPVVPTGGIIADTSPTVEGGYVPHPSENNDMLMFTDTLTSDIVKLEFELINSKAGDEVWFVLRNTEVTAITNTTLLVSQSISFITDQRLFQGNTNVFSDNGLTWPESGVVAYVVDFTQRQVRFYVDGTLTVTVDMSASWGDTVFQNRDKVALGLQGQGSGVNESSIRVRTDESTFIHSYT